MQAQVPGPVIERGYPFSIRLSIATTPGLFPEGAAITGHVKAKRTDTTPLAVLSTGTGELVRVSDTVLDLTIPGDVTSTFPVASAGAPALATVIMDFVRTDLADLQHLHFSLQVPVMVPVTLPGAL